MLFLSFTIFLIIILHNVVSDFDCYLFQLLGPTFHYNLLGGAMVIVGGRYCESSGGGGAMVLNDGGRAKPRAKLGRGCHAKRAKGFKL